MEDDVGLDEAGRRVPLPGEGVSLAADAYGDESDPPVLLFHGGGQTRHAWGGTAARLAAAGWYAVSADLRGHGDSEWSPDGVYGMDRFAADVASAAASFDRPPVLVGASLGGLSSLVAIGERTPPIAVALVLVDVTPRIEREGAGRIRDFMFSGLDGFASLEEAADAIAAYAPLRPRPKDPSGLKKNLRYRDGRWWWHWDPRFMGAGEVDGGEPRPQHKSPVDHDRALAAARHVTVPTLLVRGRMSDIVSEAGVAELLGVVPHASVVDVAGAGHMVAGDRNDAFTGAVVTFLEQEVRPLLEPEDREVVE
jgi:pimeloyl-ACP methyl ester carboxylesterase